jgi:hypothetical protein
VFSIDTFPVDIARGQQKEPQQTFKLKAEDPAFWKLFDRGAKLNTMGSSNWPLPRHNAALTPRQQMQEHLDAIETGSTPYLAEALLSVYT